MKVIYTRAKLRAAVPHGSIVRNPRFFNATEKGAEVVYLNGEWPDVKHAYEKAGVPVHDIADLPTPDAPEPLLKPEDQKRGKR